MKISAVIIVLNEEGSISSLLDSLLAQTKKPDEIVIIDGGSSDKTVPIIRHHQKKDKRIKLLAGPPSRAKQRNLGVEIAKNEIIAMTDAGCIPKSDWLKRITKPLINGQVDVVAGFYEMSAKNYFQKATSIFIGITPSKFNITYLPTTRSIAFTKRIWEEVGGFPEYITGTAEDTVFSYNLLKVGAKITRMKNARVVWGTPKSVGEYFTKIKNYAKGDIMTGIWRYPTKQYMSHNIRASLVIFRYLFGLTLLFFGISNPLLLWLAAVGLIFYIFWAYRKAYLEFNNIKAALWGIFVQFLSDFAVMTGFLSGLRLKLITK